MIDENERFRTVVRYLNVKRTRFWPTMDEAIHAVSVFQVKCHDLALKYSAEIWERTEHGYVMQHHAEDLTAEEKIIFALQPQTSA